MRAYLVTYTEDGKVLARRYAGSQAEAREHKGQLAERAGVGPRYKGLEVEEVEVPTGKAELLAFINAVSAAGDRLDGDNE